MSIQPNDSPIDIEALLKRCMNDTGFVKEILAVFHQQSVVHLDHMRDRIKAADTVGVAKLAHAMKGSAANLAANRLSECCAALEQIAGEGSISRAVVAFPALNEEFARCVAFFPQVLAKLEKN